MIRPLARADVSDAQQVAARALRDLDVRSGRPPFEVTPEVAERGRLRIGHLQATDPDGAWIAEVDGDVVGCALALVRDGMWFLSLLMVDPSHQGKGVGRELLDATLTTSTARSWILSTDDPAAVRRYQRAGFDLHPSYTAKGPVRRTGMRPVPGVREGSFDADADLIDSVSRTVRGASLLPDLPFLKATGAPLLIAPEGGYAVLRKGAVAALAATSEDVARRLLWAALAEVGDEVEVDWLAADQQWAIDVCLDARLSLTAGASLCRRGQPAMSPYLPSGALG